MSLNIGNEIHCAVINLYISTDFHGAITTDCAFDYPSRKTEDRSESLRKICSTMGGRRFLVSCIGDVFILVPDNYILSLSLSRVRDS